MLWVEVVTYIHSALSGKHILAEGANTCLLDIHTYLALCWHLFYHYYMTRVRGGQFPTEQLIPNCSNCGSERAADWHPPPRNGKRIWGRRQCSLSCLAHQRLRQAQPADVLHQLPRIKVGERHEVGPDRESMTRRY